MAFLFKSKKNQSTGLPPATRNITSSDGPGSQIPVANGFAAGDRGRSVQNTPTPGNSVNNSLNSIASNTNTPSPESKTLQRERADSEPHPANRGIIPQQRLPPDQSPYPWSQWRLNFTNNLQNPFPRYGAAANAHASKDGSIYLMGGLVNGSTVKGDLWMVEAFATSSMACYPIQTTSEGPGPRVGHASLLVGNAFIVFGGDTKLDDGDMLDDTLYLLNTSTKQWSRALPAGPRPPGRYGHTLNILGSKIYIFGGQVEGLFYNDLVAFDLNNLQNPNNRWEVLLPNSTESGMAEGLAPAARTNHTMVTWNDKLYLFGGTDGINWFNDVWSYDPKTNSWTQQECIGYIPAAREGHAAALVQDVMYIFGGRTEEGVDLGDLAAFRISTRRWYTFQNMGPSPSPRSGHSMTAFGKQVVVLAGEPSSAPRDPAELSLAFILDTGKIRYPNDQQIQQTPSGERVQGNRRPSAEQAGRGVVTTTRPTPRDQAEEAARRMTRETAPAVQPPVQQRVQDQSVNTLAGFPGAGSRLPRVTNAQGPPGPPPAGQAPQPKINGAGPGPRGKTPPVVTRALGPAVDNSQVQSGDKENTSPSTQETPSITSQREQSPGQSGRYTPNSGTSARQPKQSFEEAAGGFSRSTSRSKRQQPSQDSEDFGFQRPSIDEQSSSISRDAEGPSKNLPIDSGLGSSPALLQQNDELVKEIEAVRNKNAWYASELALARKAGYSPSENQSLEDRSADAFGDDDRPLVEALLKMRNELSRIQGAIDTQSSQTASKIAEVEKQRDNAINEAVYAKAKLVAHGGSVASTPQPDGSRGMGTPEGDRSNEMSRRLASSITAQTELSRKLDGLIQELEAEKRARELAEDTAEAAQKRVSELDMYRQHNASEMESLRSELHESQHVARQEAAKSAEAVASSQMLTIDKNELSTKLESALADLQTHTATLDSLHSAVNASADKATTLERKLEDESNTRNMIEQTLAKVRAQHEEKATELESTTRRLRDAEEMAEKHALEASTHREAVLAGLNNIRDSRSMESTGATDERVTLLQQQVESANTMARENQEAADQASDKLRRAEERIAGLEAYQEQASRESLSIRKQLQSALKDTQNHHTEKAELQQRLASQQLEANAIAVQHGALRDILAERGISASDARRSRALDSPNSMTRFGTPEMSRMRELEQQLEASMRAHEDLKSTFEVREQEVSKEYQEKLEALDNDHQAAVKYLRGTEKMLSKMKQELQRYKNQNTELEKELTASKNGSARGLETSSKQWAEERTSLQKQLRDMESRAQDSLSSLEAQMARVQDQLASAQRERDEIRDSHRSSQLRLDAATEQHARDLEHMRRENSLLEARAADAEQKVQLLLDQVESSVDNYRRQSQQMLPNGTSHRRGVSTATLDSITSPITPTAGAHHQQTGGPIGWTPGHRAADSASGDSVYSSSAGTARGGPGSLDGAADEGGSNPSPADARNSLALDSLASELDALRTHWETQHKNNFRLSDRFELDHNRTPTRETVGGRQQDAEGGGATGLANWRRGLSEDHAGEEDKGRRGS